MPLTSLEKALRLRRMLAQVAPAEDGAVSSFLESAGSGSADPSTVADDLFPRTSPEQFGHLEAIVMTKYRPVVFVRDRTYDDVPAPWSDLLNAAAVKTRLSQLFPSVGRIELPDSPIAPYAGTGFVVGPNLLMTNRHVAQLFSYGLGMRITYREGGSAVDFRHSIDSAPGDRSGYLKVTDIPLIHPYWDMALLRVDGLADRTPLRLSTAEPDSLFGKNVVVIGYPAPDARNDMALQNQVFQNCFYVKRLQPGQIRQRALVACFDRQVEALTHDCSTLGGNSGSCVVDVDTGEVVALHFAGEYLEANYAVPMWELARDSRLASSRLNFDGSVTTTNDWEPAWQAADAAEQPAASVADTAPEAVVVNQDYSDRPGYDPGFLGEFRVPLPKISPAMAPSSAQVAASSRVHNDPYELAYYHYSVYMNTSRRTAWFSAANVDGKQRPNIGARSGDRWYVDTRIPASAQLAESIFESGIDRGHLTRRDDTAWGSDVKDATLANNDTFHFTNCSLQVSGFNRGKDRWQGLEQFLLEQHAKKDKMRMTVITGPVFDEKDPPYQNSKMKFKLQIPLRFWKVCVLLREDGSPAATGFILGQPDARNLPGTEAVFDVVASQVKIADLARITGLDFGDLPQHDHFAQGGKPGTLETISDIVV